MRKLRIFYASDTTPNAWFRHVKSNIWRNNLLLPLRDMGHDVVEFQYDLTATFKHLDTQDARQAAFIGVNRPAVSAELLRQIREAHAAEPFDLFFSYFYDACVEPAAIDVIRAMGIQTVNWYCNGSYQLHLVREISPRYDFCLVPEKFRMGDYVAMGARPIYCQEAANPTLYKPYDVPKEFDVTFVGQAYGERPELVKYLLDRGVKVQVWGHGWRKPEARWMPASTYETILAIPDELRHDPLADEEMVKVYSRSKINLGFSTCGDTHLAARPIVQVRLRDFEVPMAGGFYIVGRMPELDEFFVPEEEVVTYGGKEELAEKVAYYLLHGKKREAIRQAGHARALKDHTWQGRFAGAFAEMGLTGCE